MDERHLSELVAAWLEERADVPRGGAGKRSQLGSRVAGGAE